MKICERLINQHARNHMFIKQRSYTRSLYIIAPYTIDRIGSTKKVRAKSNLLIQERLALAQPLRVPALGLKVKMKAPTACDSYIKILTIRAFCCTIVSAAKYFVFYRIRLAKRGTANELKYISVSLA